jgi:hypothetical protein
MYQITPHLHLEVDTDFERPYTTPTVQKSNFLRKALPKQKLPLMMNPLDVLHVKTGGIYKQEYTTTDTNFVHPDDKKLPKIK